MHSITSHSDGILSGSLLVPADVCNKQPTQHTNALYSYRYQRCMYNSGLKIDSEAEGKWMIYELYRSNNHRLPYIDSLLLQKKSIKID